MIAVMNLRDFLNSLSTKEQEEFANKCETSIGYLRKALSRGQKLGESLCIEMEKHSNSVVTCEEVRSDVDWAYLRGTSPVNAENPPNFEESA